MIIEVYRKNNVNRLECIKSINLDTVPRKGDAVIIRGRAYVVASVVFDFDNAKCKLEVVR